MSAVSACPACAYDVSELWATASDEEYFTTARQYSYRRCARCAALFIDPVPRNALDAIYPSNYYSFDDRVTGSVLFRVKDALDRRFFRRFVKDLPQESLRVLDVGGGSGAQLSAFRTVDARIAATTIVDLDLAARERALERGHDYYCGRFEEYAPGSAFEIILMLNLIEHVDKPAQLLAKARTLLATNGILIVKTPNTDSWDARLFRDRNWGGYHCPRHWVLFNRENFMATVAAAGLRVRHFQYTQGAPFWTTSVMFALGRRKWIHTAQDRPVPAHPLYPVLNAFFAGFDILRAPFARTSQMLAVLERT